MQNLNNTIIKEYVSIILYKKPLEVWINKRINPHKEFYQHWQCPGGHVETTDISARHAAQREMMEETGLQIKLQDLDYIRTNHYSRRNEWRIVHCYFLQTNEKPMLREPKEMTTWKLKNINEIWNEPMIDSLKDAFKGRQKQTQKIMIEGNCGAGKSTLVQILKEYYENKGKTVELMDEAFITQDPQERIVNYGNHLKKYQENEITQEQMIKEAVKLENWIRNEWMKQIYQFTIKENKPDILLVDRNLFSTIIFMKLMNEEGIYPKEDLQITCKNYKYWEFWKREAKIIWWKTPTEESLKRLISRGRAGEQNLEYYKNLDRVYEENMLNIYPNVEVITRETLLSKDKLKEVIPLMIKE